MNKFCGNFLTAQKDGKANIAVCGKDSLDRNWLEFGREKWRKLFEISDCTAPFEIGVITDDMNDSEDGKTDNEAMSRGDDLK